MAAATVLLVGVLGTVSMVDAASKSTTTNDRRAVGTATARDVLEGVRGVPYTALADGTLLAKVQAEPGLADAATDQSGWQIRRSNVVYAVTLTSCAVDDPKDGAGAHDSTFCANGIAAGGVDRKPNDYSRVTVDVAWTKAGGGSDRVRQSTIVNNTYRGPTVVALDTVPAGVETVFSGSSVAFTATTNPAAARVEWYLDGKYRGNATGSGTAWQFTWNLGSACGASSVRDGSYQIGAQGFDSGESSFGPYYRSVLINRCAPSQVADLEGGRNGSGGIDLQWQPNPEDDVIGYRVYRGTSSTSLSQISGTAGDTSCAGLIANRTSCTDPDTGAIAGRTVYYKVVAVDEGADGQEREGTQSALLTVTTTNRPPNTPVIYPAEYNGTSYGTLFWVPVTDPDKGDSISFYRIYRDGKTAAHRYDVYDWLGGQYVLWNDEKTDGVTHTYWVTAVDSHLRESEFSNGVTR